MTEIAGSQAAGGSDMTVQTRTENPEIPFAVFKQHVKQARASVTRRCNDVAEKISFEEVSVPKLSELRRAKQAISEATEHLCNLFDKWVLFPDICQDEQRLEQEFEKHEAYSLRASEALEDLQQKIDRIAEALGVSADGSAEGVGQQSQPSDQLLPEEDADAIYQSQEQFEAQPGAAGPQLVFPGGYQDQARGFQSTPFPAPIYVAQDPSSKVPKFSGDPLRFQEWNDMFSYYVDSQQLEPTEKCRILKSSLVGRAGRPIAHLRVCAENYEMMKKIVRERFGGDIQIKASHIHRIHAICAMKDLDKDARLVEFVSQLGQHLHSLVALGSDLGSLSTALVPVVLAAVPSRLRLKFNSQWMNEGGSGSPQLESLLGFLEKHATLLEVCEQQARFGNLKASENPSGSGQYRQGFQQRFNGQKGLRHVGSFGAAVNKPNHSCIFCGKGHDSFKCELKLSAEECRKRATNAMACFRCLRRNHGIKDCRAKRENCRRCGGRHASMLCTRQLGPRQTDQGRRDSDHQAAQTGPSAMSLVSGATVLQSCQTRFSQETVLQTGYVRVLGNSKELVCRVILDPGSQRSFVSSRVVKALNLSPSGSENINIHGIVGQVSSGQQIDVFNITVRSRFSSKQLSLSCLEVPKIIQTILPRAQLEGAFWGPVADEREEGFPEEIDILFGADILPRIYDGMYRKIGKFMATPTIFGWFAWGNSGSNHFTGSVVTSLGVVQSIVNSLTVASTQVNPQEKPERNLKDIEFLWDTEFLGIESPQQDEAVAENRRWEMFFKNTVKREVSGRYIVSLPFKENIDVLGDNQKIAFSRLMGFLKNAKKNPQLLGAVDKEIQKSIDLGYAELAEPRKHRELAHYLPLLAVAKKSLGNSEEFKVRVVKDGSCRSQDEGSLNDVLEKGPNCLPDIILVLLHFRRRDIAIIADIVKAFNQIAIDKDHRKFLRFFWAQGISENPSAPVREFWATVLDFGLVCSPWLHCAAVRHHLDQEGANNPDLADLLQEVRNSFYMDDISLSKESLPEAKAAVDALRVVFLRGKFPLDKWATNSEELSEYIRDVTGAEQSAMLPREQSIKFLGIPWCRVDDSLSIDVAETSTFVSAGAPTKRKLLRGLSRIFDPLGIVAPISINFKMLLQSLWVEKVDWDSNLQGDFAEAYALAVDNLKWCKELSIKRNMVPSFPNSVRELHVFADASLKAYGAVAYIRQMQVDGTSQSPTVSFALAKARVAPLKGKLTIHRLELLAAIVAVRLAKKILSAHFLEIGKVYYYSDNAAVLGWIRDPSKLNSFVGRRVKEILADTGMADWSYIRSEENPADLLSRGYPLDSAESRERWLGGPPWLVKGSRADMHALNGEQVKEGDAERQSAAAALSAALEPPPLLISKHFSTWSKAVRITSFARRFPAATRSRSSVPAARVISAAEFEEAEAVLLRNIQRHYFHLELRLNCEGLPKSSVLYKLNPFVDDRGFIRCRSRLQNSELLSYEEKNPLILPGEEFLVQLYVRWVHGVVCLHSGGIDALLHQLRARVLILKARATAKKAVGGCKTCMKFRAKPAILPQPTLPAFRIESGAPFSFTGVDHAGPIFFKKENGEEAKCYILLLVCAITRAVRLELVPSLSTYDFLLAFRGFINRNPGVRHLISDNARTFHRARRELFSLYDQIQSPGVQSFLSQRKLRWSFSTSRCPWGGGFFERLVGVIKGPLRKAVGVKTLPFRELQAVLTDVEKVVNDRPITSVVVDPDEFKALSPSDLLYGYGTQPGLPDVEAIMESVKEADSIVFAQRWRRLQSILQSFWKNFQSGYLQHLRSAHRATPQDSRPLKVGDVCILKSVDAHRAFWPLCVVQKVFGGKNTDGLQRSCEIRTASGQILERPIKLLYPLEVSQF